jgi:VanZ family protein
MNARARAWLLFLAMLAFIIATLQPAYEVSLFLKVRGFQTRTVLLTVVAAALVFAYLLLVGARLRSPWIWLRAAPAVALYLYAMATFIQLPVERFHFVEYFVLFVLALRAAALDLRGAWAYLAATAATALAGLLDEIAQGLNPVRYFDWHDVRMNALAAALAALVCFALFGRNPRLALFEHVPAPRADGA